MSLVLNSARRRALAPAAILAAFLLSGCGGSGTEVETFWISGTVTSGVQPVEEGTISFEDPQTGSAGQANLGPGGAYELELPAGSYRVAIEPPLVEVTAPATEPHMSYKDMPAVPEKYRTATTSGLEVSVSEDAEGVNFEMTSADSDGSPAGAKQRR